MIGSEIKEKIKAKGFTLRYVAEKMGTTPQNLQQLLRADMHVNSDTMERVARAIGEPISYFYEEEELILLRRLIQIIKEG
jgi:transcriptional regulator with XRE-family HTH domain